MPTITIRNGEIYKNYTMSVKCSTIERARKANLTKSLSKMLEETIERELAENGA